MSLRKGHFKKYMLSKEQLVLEAAELYPKLLPIIHFWKSNKITDAEMVGCYIIAYSRHRYPHHWISGKIQLTQVFDQTIYLEDYFIFSQHEKKNIPKNMNLATFFSTYSLRSVPKAVNIMLVEWISKKAELELLEFIPTPKMVLAQQQMGKRVVTMITDFKLLSTYILGERDPLGFLIHDLQHAEKFFSHHETQKGQIGFYHFIAYLSAISSVQQLLINDPKFREEFEYAMSDMNAYCVHLLKYLTSAFREACLRGSVADCPFLQAIESIKDSTHLKELIKDVYKLKMINEEETIVLQSFFENISERGYVFPENNERIVP